MKVHFFHDVFVEAVLSERLDLCVLFSCAAHVPKAYLPPTRERDTDRQRKSRTTRPNRKRQREGRRKSERERRGRREREREKE